MSDLTTAHLPSGHRARYQRQGQGPALLYLRSSIVPAADQAFIEALAGNFDVIAPVHPGFRDLDELTDLDAGADLAFYYDDLRRVLGLDRMSLVGHSFGGLVAAELAAYFPDRVDGLALVAPLGLWDPEEPPADLARRSPAKLFAQLSQPADSHSSAASAGSASDGYVSAAGVAVDDYDAEHIVAATRAMTTALKYIWPFPAHSFARRLYRITTPTRLYWGQDDTVIPVGYADRFAQAIDGATTDIRSGGHLLVQDQPEELAGQIGDFLAAAGTA